ncbi:lysophospholipid acyltransferase family protein [Streptacidiphilus sp. P02-A3a]|uniref:lysophospholipid acyltransferase family protein n=1 Tax=Streptacidiphilus sp. P02-A3a TaxID=2704468 RepID=UPI0015F86AEA|nr:lysophospholipid acyltransferase family protein [Streptacidiphilus sp. P02-A3a]QMU72962.1 acyltransferase family protein [Streptacidiphilus sp. P02-A3a]
MSSARERAVNEAKVIPIGGRRAGGRAKGGERTAAQTAQAASAAPGVAAARTAARAARAAGGGQVPPVSLAPPVAPVAPDADPAPGAVDDGAERGMAEAVAGAVGSVLAGPLGGLAERALGKGWEARAAGGLGFLRRRLTGEYRVDEFGFDPELTDKVLLTAIRPIAEKYFRLDVRGAEHLPTEGGALVVANHSGVVPWDALMTQVAIHDHTPGRRHLRMLAADLVFVLPGVNELARKAGHTLACNEDAQRLLELGEIVGVWPEGFKGIGKPFSERYKLQRFGRGGFVSSALKAGVPIIPCSIMGAEETYPMIGNARTVARLLGLPYVPITPTFPWLGPLGAVPLPTKWTIQFGEPIPTHDYPPEAADDPMLVFNLTDQVRETVQHTLYRLLVQRRSVFF